MYISFAPTIQAVQTKGRTMKKTLVQAIDSAFRAYSSCMEKVNKREEPARHWIQCVHEHEARIVDLEDELPSGSGFDSGTKLDLDESKPNRLVFNTAFHHMDEHGGYDGWTEHKVIVYPTFDGFRVIVQGKDRNGIKEYIGDTFRYVLGKEV